MGRLHLGNRVSLTHRNTPNFDKNGSLRAARKCEPPLPPVSKWLAEGVFGTLAIPDVRIGAGLAVSSRICAVDWPLHDVTYRAKMTKNSKKWHFHQKWAEIPPIWPKTAICGLLASASHPSPLSQNGSPRAFFERWRSPTSELGPGWPCPQIFST